MAQASVGTVYGDDDGDYVQVEEHSLEGRFWSDTTPIVVCSGDEARHGVSAYLNVAQAKKLRKLLKRAIVRVENR